VPTRLKAKSRHFIEYALALAPWLVSMYVFYWLDSSGTWNSQTPHRGKLSVVLLAAGMFASFLVHSYFSERRRK
jgi:hypothetical protein